MLNFAAKKPAWSAALAFKMVFVWPCISPRQRNYGTTIVKKRLLDLLDSIYAEKLDQSRQSCANQRGRQWRLCYAKQNCKTCYNAV